MKTRTDSAAAGGRCVRGDRGVKADERSLKDEMTAKRQLDLITERLYDARRTNELM